MQVRSSAETLDEVIERYHAALDPFLRGEPEPMKALFSHQGRRRSRQPVQPRRPGLGGGVGTAGARLFAVQGRQARGR